VLLLGTSIPVGPTTMPCPIPPKLEIAARGVTWIRGGLGIGVSSGSPASHQSAASASLKTEPGGA
jgi:hypothetical protein